MKSIVTTILIYILSTSFINAQCDLPTVDGQFQHQEITEVDSTNKKQLYKSMLLTLAELYKDSEEVIEYKDQEEGVVLIRYYETVFPKGITYREHFFKFDVRFEFKDGKYRSTANYISHYVLSGTSKVRCDCANDILNKKCGTTLCCFDKDWNKSKCKGYEQLKATLSLISSTVKQNTKKKSNDDW